MPSIRTECAEGESSGAQRAFEWMVSSKGPSSSSGCIDQPVMSGESNLWDRWEQCIEQCDLHRAPCLPSIRIAFECGQFVWRGSQSKPIKMSKLIWRVCAYISIFIAHSPSRRLYSRAPIDLVRWSGRVHYPLH